MKLRFIMLSVIAGVMLTGFVFGSTNSGSLLAEQAVSGNGSESAEAIRKLRELGPEGLNSLFSVYAADVKSYRETGQESENWKKIAAALDKVAMQKDSYAARLYWYTDLEEAKRAASKTGRPILSLRLLGNLNEEFSCANSRLFRSLLYSNTEVSNYLRENYILHWKSVRPAPRITIDFGDGRKIERTITGNSIHYLLDDDGKIIDALPGLYSPKAFMIYITQARQVNDAIDGKPGPVQDLALMRYRKLCFDRIREKRERVGRQVKVTTPKNLLMAGTDAFSAAPRAMAKMMATDEISLLRVYDNFSIFAPQFDFSDWEKLAVLYSPMPALDGASTAFVLRQTSKTGLTEAEFNKMFTKLRGLVGLDTTRNDFLYHMQLYSWLNDARKGDLEAFNARVYADIFKTPNSDEWLGLYSTDVYTALDGNGIIK